jgi:hypothetical protein
MIAMAIRSPFLSLALLVQTAMLLRDGPDVVGQRDRLEYAVKPGGRRRA